MSEHDRRFILVHDQARKGCAAYAMAAPDGMVVTFKEAKRTTDQNAKFHSICGDLAKSQMTWAGKRRTLAQWKVLLVSGHAVATKEGNEFTAGIEGEYINLRESTALMSIKRGSSLIEYALCFCAQNGVTLTDKIQDGY